MATPGKFVEIVAETLGVPYPTVVVYDRQLADGGYRTKGARGLNAPHVTARDAAHLLTAILAGAEVKESVASVRRYEDTYAEPSASGSERFKLSGIKMLTSLPSRHSFLDALEALLKAAGHGHLPKTALAEIAVLTPGNIGDIRLAGLGDRPNCHVIYTTTPRKVAQRSRPSEAGSKLPDLEQYRRISERTLFTLGKILTTNDGGN